MGPWQTPEVERRPGNYLGDIPIGPPHHLTASAAPRPNLSSTHARDQSHGWRRRGSVAFVLAPGSLRQHDFATNGATSTSAYLGGTEIISNVRVGEHAIAAGLALAR